MFWVRFDPTRPDVRFWARLLSLRGIVWCEMVLDTGSSRTVLDERLLARAGYDLIASPKVTVTTASGRMEAKIVTVRQISALGISADDFPVLAMPLSQPLGIDGLLGLDFLRLRNLFCNFEKGILLTLPFSRNLTHRFALSAQIFAAL
ncbi:retropepsin-like aspartic protease [Fervidibacter sacchari]